MKNGNQGGRKRLPPYLVEVIRRNSGLVHAIACEIIKDFGLTVSGREGPVDLRDRAKDAVAKKISHLKNETLGRIISVGYGTAKRDDSPTTMAEVHNDDAAWLANAGELSGRKLLEGIAATVIIARMFDIIERVAERADEKAA